MANTKRVPEEQIPMTEIKEEPKPEETSVPAVEPTVSTEETPVKDEGKKEEKKTILRKVADWADAKDQKNKQKKADKLHKQEQKKAEKEAKKTTLGSKLKKAALIGGGAVVAIGGGLLAYEMSKPSDGAVYVDNGTPTTYIPEQTQSTPVEEASIEPAVTETNSSETAGTVVETTSNE